MYPPVGIGQMREAMAGVSLAGKLQIPKGAIVWISHYAMHNCHHNWEEPGKFKPGGMLKAKVVGNEMTGHLSKCRD